MFRLYHINITRCKTKPIVTCLSGFISRAGSRLVMPGPGSHQMFRFVSSFLVHKALKEDLMCGKYRRMAYYCLLSEEEGIITLMIFWSTKVSSKSILKHLIKEGEYHKTSSSLIFTSIWSFPHNGTFLSWVSCQRVSLVNGDQNSFYFINISIVWVLCGRAVRLQRTWWQNDSRNAARVLSDWTGARHRRYWLQRSHL